LATPGEYDYTDRVWRRCGAYCQVTLTTCVKFLELVKRALSRLTGRVDAVCVVVVVVGVAEVRTQRFLLVGSADALSELSTEHASTLVGEELERRPRGAVVDALVQPIE